MQIEIFTLCEYARLQDQSLTIVHTFENWFIPEAGGTITAMFVIKVRFDHSEEGVHQLAVRLIDPDGRSIFEAPIKLDVRIPDTRSYQFTVLGRMSCPISVGHHSLRLLAESHEVLAFPLYVSRK